MPVKLTPYGAGRALNPSGNPGVGAFGTVPNGTITVGYPGLAAMAAPLAPGKSSASSDLRLHHFVDAVRGRHRQVALPVRS